MSASNDPIAPIQPVGTEPAEPVEFARTPAPLGSVAPVSSVGRPAPPVPTPPVANPRAPIDPSVGSVVAQLDVEVGSLVPRSVNAGALIHDAAAHGDAIAIAIERAHPAPGTVLDVTDRAQQLGGAAASAHAGQGTPRPSRVDRKEEEIVDPADSLSPAARIGDDAKDGRGRRRRHGEERELGDPPTEGPTNR